MNEVTMLLVIVLAFVGMVAFLFLKSNSPKKLDDSTELSEVIPIQSIENGMIVNGNGDITVGFKLIQPDVFIISTSEAFEIHDNFVGVLKMLPEGTIFHKQDFFFMDEFKKDDIEGNNVIHKENVEFYNGRKVIKNYSNLYLTFTNHYTINKGKTTSLQEKANYPFKQPFGDLGKRIDEINNYTMSFRDRVNGIPGFKALRMETEVLGCAVYDYLNLKYEEPSLSAKDKVINPIGVDSDGLLKIGNQYIAILTLSEEGEILEPHVVPRTAPGTVYGNGVSYSNTIKSKTSMVFPIACGLPIDHVVNTVIQVTDNDKTIGELSSEKKSLNFIAPFYGPAKVKQEITQRFIDTITGQSLQTCITSVNVIIRDTSRDNLQRKIGYVENAFMNMNKSRCFVENFDTANIFFSNIPGNANTNYRGFINTTVQAACYINKESMVSSSISGSLFCDRYGNPIVIDTWNNEGIMNRNKLVIGPSGSGKSYFVNGFSNQSLIQSNHVIIIDIGHSYKRNCEINGGKYFDSSSKKNLSFNVFLCDKDDKGNYRYKNEEDKEESDSKLNFIVSVIELIWKGKNEANNEERQLLKRSVERYYDYVNEKRVFPKMKTYYEFLDVYEKMLNENELKMINISSLKLLLEEFVTGEYSFILNSEEIIDVVNDNFIVFDMEAVQGNEKLFPLISMMIIELVIQKMWKLKGERKSLIVDEALNFLEDPKMSEFIAYLFRTFRKKEGEIYIAAQNVKFLEYAAPKIRDSIIINTDTVILLDHSGHRSNYQDIKRILSFTDHQIELLDSLQKGNGWREFLLKLGKKTYIMRMEVSEFADSVFTSRENEVKQINDLYERTGSLPAAIRQYNEDKKQLKKL